MKKILAVIFAVSMLFSVMPSAFAAENEKTDFDFAATLGFIDGEIMDEDAVITRIQLAEVFYNIIFPNQKDASQFWGEADFPDVPLDKKHIAATVYGMNIMKGYSDTQFAPDDPVTYNQLVKTFIVFLGYDLHAGLLGGWPTGYLSKAAQLGILPQGAGGDSYATVASVCMMLKKCVGVDIATYDGDGTAIVQKGVDYLDFYRNIEVKKGTITGNYLTNINTYDATSYFCVYINGEKFGVSASAAGIQDMIGFEVYAYYEKTDLGNTIVYFEEGRNNILEIAAENIVSVRGKEITYFADEYTTNSVYFSNSSSVIYNGSSLTSYTDADLNPFIHEAVDGGIVLIDKNFDNVFDTVVINAYKTYVVSDVSNTRIFNVFDPSEVVNIEDYVERNIDIRNVYGEPLEPESIEEGQVINVLVDKNGKVKQIIVSKAAITGEIEEISRTGGRVSAIKVSGITFKTSSAVALNDSQNRLAPGRTVELFFNCQGKIAYIDVDNHISSGFNTGLLVDAANESGLDGGAVFLIFSSDGEMIEGKFANSVNFCDTIIDDSDVISRLPKSADGRVDRQAVLYKTNENGEISALTIADTSGNFQNGFYMFPKGDGSDNENYRYTYRGSFRSFDNKFVTDEDTVIFGMPPENDRDKYEKYTITALSTTEGTSTLKADAYGTHEDGMVADVVVINNTYSGESDNSRRPIFIVTKISEIIDEDGEPRTKIFGSYVQGTSYAEGSFVTDISLFETALGRSVEIGDIFRVPTFSVTGKVEELAARDFLDVFDYSTKTFMAGGANPNSPEEGHSYRYGKVVLKNGNVAKIRLYNANGTLGSDTEVCLLTASLYKIIEVKTNSSGEIQSVKQGTPNSVISERTRPGEGSDVLIYNRGSGIAIFVFN